MDARAGAALAAAGPAVARLGALSTDPAGPSGVARVGRIDHHPAADRPTRCLGSGTRRPAMLELGGHRWIAHRPEL